MTVNYLTYVPKGKTKQEDFIRVPLGKDVPIKEARKIAFRLLIRGEVAWVKPNKYLPLQMAVYLQHTNKYGGLNPLGTVFSLHYPWIQYKSYDIKRDVDGPWYDLNKDGSLGEQIERRRF